MAYEKKEWYSGETITASKLNRIENGIDELDKSTTNLANNLNSETQTRTSEIDTLTSNLNSEIQTRTSEANTLKSRVDQIIAPTGEAPNPSEITDARVGADGKTYDSLGNAIRTQVTNLKSAIYSVTSTDNLFDKDSPFENGTYKSTGAWDSTANYVTYDYVVLPTGATKLYSNSSPTYIYFDANKQFILRVSAASSSDVPNGATYLRVSMIKTSAAYSKIDTLMVVVADNPISDMPYVPAYRHIINPSLELSSKVYNTVNDMVNDTDLISGCVRTLGYHSIGDDGGATYVISDAISNANLDIQLSNKHYACMSLQKEINPMQCGAYGDGSHDDSAYVQKALDSGIDVVLSNNHYITSTVVISTNYQRIHGKMGTNIRRTGKLIADDTSDLTNGALLVINATGCSIHGIGFEFADDGVKRIGVYIDRTNGEARQEFDSDTHVTSCYFRELNTGIRYVGRGLKASDNLFGSCLNGIWCSLPNIYDSNGAGYLLVNPFGGRGMQITNNRAHNNSSSGTLVKITGEKHNEYLEFLIANNTIDHRGNLIVSEPMQRSMIILGNTVVNNTDAVTAAPAVSIKYADGLVITGNAISAVRSQEDVDEELDNDGIEYNETITHTAPNYAISLGVDGEIKNSVICNNSILYFKTHTIENGSIINSIIKNNIYSVALVSDQSMVSGCIISDNMAFV